MLRTTPPLVRQCMPTITFSSELIVWNSRMFWNVRPIPSSVTLCGGSPAISVPSNVDLP